MTVTQIVDNETTARSEVQRLSNLNGNKGCRYFWQATRYKETPN